MRTGSTRARIVEELWYGHSRAACMARKLVTPASWLMSLAVRLRSALYDRDLLRTERAPLPVVSVGNLRVGGMGKTPIVIWLVSRLAALGYRPLVATRGYGFGSEGLLLDLDEGVPAAARRLVEAHGFSLVDAGSAERSACAADEAELVARLGRVPVAIARNRVEAARLAADLGRDCVVLDDGFQHRKLRRDLDIVLVSPLDECGRLLPSGPLREPWRALGRAGVVLSVGGYDPPALTGRLVARARQEAVGLVREVDAGAEVLPLDSLHGHEVVAVAGIARPERMLTMLARAGARVRRSMLFPDHYAYGEDDWRGILHAAAGGAWVVTTEKDLVKLRRHARDASELFALRIRMAIDPEEPVLQQVLRAIDPLDAPRMGPHDR